MAGQLHTIGDVRVYECDASGPALATAQDALDLLAEGFGTRADWTAIPVARLAPDFFDLSNRRAGEVLQKFANYRARVAIVGDVSDAIARSTAVRDLVREANRGRSLWFVADLADLTERLGARGSPAAS